MHTTVALGFTAFVLCFLLTPLCRNLSLRFNIVDHPDNDRKFHAAPIPRIGGVAIVLAYAGASVCAKNISCSVLDICTSMRLNDDLNSGIST